MSGFVSPMDLVAESEVRLRRAGATEENFWRPVSEHEELAKRVVALVTTLRKPVFCLVADFKCDKRNDGWELVSDFEAKEDEFTPELVGFLKLGEDPISGEEMLKRVESAVCLSQRHAEAMLAEPYRILEEFKEPVLVFPDTIWQNLSGNSVVACLDLSRDRQLHFVQLRCSFDRRYRVVCLKAD